MDNQQMTIKELAEYLRISRLYAYKLVKTGKIKFVNVGIGSQRNRYRIFRKDLDEFIEKGGI